MKTTGATRLSDHRYGWRIQCSMQKLMPRPVMTASALL